MKRIITSHNDFEALLGKMIGCSPSFTINKEYVSAFRDSTYTSQESDNVPEFLLISLTPYLWNSIVDVKNINMVINYGLLSYTLGLINWKLRLLKLPSELFNKKGKNVKLILGDIISPEIQDNYSEMNDYGEFLRDSVYKLK